MKATMHRIATFCSEGETRRSKVRTYTRDYNPQWAGYLEIRVLATSVKEARIGAVDARLRYERERSEASS